MNSNDAQAAIKAWAGAIATERSITISPSTVIVDGLAEIEDGLKKHRIDAITLSAAEYWTIRDMFSKESTFIGSSHGETTERYVVLVNAKSDFQTLNDLRGHVLNVLLSPRCGISQVWLETELLEQGLGPLRPFFNRLSEDSKLSRVVLPVFFGQTDACLVTRSGFEVMCELNPQLSKQLRVIAESDPYVPTFFVFRGDWNSPLQDVLIEVLDEVASAPAGKQTLALFQQDDLVVRPVSDLDSTGELLERHARLLAAVTKQNSAKPTAQP